MIWYNLCNRISQRQIGGGIVPPNQHDYYKKKNEVLKSSNVTLLRLSEFLLNIVDHIVLCIIYPCSFFLDWFMPILLFPPTDTWKQSFSTACVQVKRKFVFSKLWTIYSTPRMPHLSIIYCVGYPSTYRKGKHASDHLIYFFFSFLLVISQAFKSSIASRFIEKE